MLFGRGVGLIVATASVAACGSILGVQPLETNNSVAVEDAAAPTQRDAAAPPDVIVNGTLPDGGDAGPPLPPVLPPEGSLIYNVKAGGGDKLEGVVGSNDPYGATATIAILHTSATCFQQTITLRSGYVETMSDFCIDGNDLVQKTDTRSQTFDIGSATTNSSCAGDHYLTTALTLNETWQHDCTGQNSDSKEPGAAPSKFETKGPYVFVGAETIAIGTQAVSVVHFHDSRVVSGAQNGTNVADWYLSPTNGLVVRLSRNVNLTYGSILGTITYVETVDMTLASPPPP